jgi:hypothetical protein
MAWTLPGTYPNARSLFRLNNLTALLGRQWIIFSILLAFAGGFAVAKVWRPTAKAVLNPPSLSDYEIDLPEGETTLSIADPRLDPETIAELTVVRRGSEITGLPQTIRQLPARSRLSPEDLEFFKHQLKGVVSPSDSLWQRANLIREWLVAQDKHAGHGITSRRAREEFEQMIAGTPALCGNLADMYVALCEAAGVTAREVGLAVMVRNG